MSWRHALSRRWRFGRTTAAMVLAAALASGWPTAARPAPFLPGQGLNQTLVSQVAASALAFMGPRTLDEIPTSVMTMWGLHGLSSVDPRLTPQLDATSLRLLIGARPVFLRPPPAEGDTSGWGEAVGQMTRAAWDGSSAIRRTGTDTLVRTFFDELFSHLDPYSRYAPPDAADEDRDRRDGRAGIGVMISGVGGGFVITAVLSEGPAAEAGLRVGDRILAIDGQTTQGADPEAIDALLAGPENTRVVVSVRTAARVRTVELTRAVVVPNTVTSQRSGDLLIVRVTAFAADTSERLRRELERGFTGTHPPHALVLDLRDNRGGLVRQAVAAGNLLLPSGVIAVTEGRDPAAGHVFTSDGPDILAGKPIVVLVDGRTASAAEILAAALADQRRGVVVGSSTLGKGLVQTVTTLPDGGELFVTWSRILAPLGWPLQGLGVLPQVCTATTPDMLRRSLDALVHGEQPLSDALAHHRDARAPMTAETVLQLRSACPAGEARDADLQTARFLVERPAAYATALVGSPAP